ncbi:maltose alpha-D-glucosyltransferase [Desulfohalovibrio reitneri]|uniref:maltose alpha-D-glucosyltransferase n=1 Tax=Desulfohalovibrio reitneri TaxID=1307759 RepID=UPI0004A6EDEB|nr:maltose alpha-D-glucosyltransferase [Desulfohalovibrio reitneri]
MNDPLWYKDAIIYELHVKCFADSNGDGIGDFKGLTKKLDYLEDLGVTAVWLLPFYPSPLRDDGYDIADPKKVNPDYGNLRDFKAFLREAHKRGIRVITEMVLNHTSDQHAWFQRARQAAPGTRHRNYYVWSETPEKYPEARIIFKDFETSNWSWDPVAKAYFWHRFYSHQPDLNFDSKDVRREVMKLLDFWLAMGVDGLRLDAIPYLYEREGTNCENLPETYEFIKQVRAHVDENHRDKMLLAEANQWPEDAVAYFGDDNACHMAFHFPLMPRMFMSLQMEDRFPIVDILDQTPEIPEGSQWAMFLRNHDELTLEMVTDEERDYMYRMYARDPRARINLGIRRRLAPLLDNDRRKIELLNVLLFTMPGSPVIYYGDEIGMGDNYYLGDRDGVRTPMQWSADRNAGFSAANPQRLFLPVIIDPEYHYEAVNVENQEHNRSSLLWWMKGIIATRKRLTALSRGKLEFVLPRNPSVLAYLRTLERDGGDPEAVLVVANLSRHPQMAELHLEDWSGFVPEEVFSRQAFPTLREGGTPFTLGPCGYYIFSLRREAGAHEVSALPKLAADPRSGELLTAKARAELARLLPGYVARRGWLADERKVKDFSMLEAVQVGSERHPCWLVITRASFVDHPPRTFNLLLSTAVNQEAESMRAESRPEVICSFPAPEGDGVIYEGVPPGEPCTPLLELVARKKSVRGRSGELAPLPGRLGRKALREGRELKTSHSISQRVNTIVLFGQRYFLKLFRQAEEGVNPDVEMVRHLTEVVGFDHTPRFVGSMEYRRKGQEPVVVASLKEYVPAETDGHSLGLKAVDRYLERVLAHGPENMAPPKLPASPGASAYVDPPDELWSLMTGSDLELFGLMGARTAEMHLALARPTRDPAFAAEPFSRLYQRSVYQTMQSSMKKVMTQLERGRSGLDEGARAEADAIREARSRCLEIFHRFHASTIRCLKLRIHGEFHLAHLLSTGKDFVVIDFEGNPERPLPERRIKRSPFRDLADMQRSIFDTAWEALDNSSWLRPEDRPGLEPWVEAWAQAAFGAFLRAWLTRAAEAHFMPENERDVTVMTDAYVLEKCFADLGRALERAPSQARVPLRAIRRMLG